MSSLTSGVGLVSGLPIGQIVDGLISAQSGPINLISTQLQNITSTRTALVGLSARLLAFKNALAALSKADVFNASLASVSNSSIVQATADSTAATGSYTFTVRQLAATHQVVSNSFSTADQTPIGAGTITLESDSARVDRSTSLTQLRGGQGIRGGVIRVTDRSGASADIDLSTARSVQDVLDAINGQSSVTVQASVQGNSIVIADQTGLTSGNLVISDRNGGHAAADLGIAGSNSSGSVTGTGLVWLSNQTQLGTLNDGNGVRTGAGGGDFSVALADGSTLNIDLSGRLSTTTRLAQLNGGAGVAQGSIQVTNRQGVTTTIDLSGTKSVGDVLNAINNSNAGVTASTVDSQIVLADGTTGTGSLTVADVNGGTTARDLGLTGSTTGTSLTGSAVLRIATLGDVVSAINLNSGNGGKLTAAISANGQSLVLTDRTNGTGTFGVTALNGSNAAGDLGLLAASNHGVITSSRLQGGLNTVLLSTLKGGAGVSTGTFQIKDGTGRTAQINVGQGQTLADLISSINLAGTGVTAAVDDSGLGIVLTDSSSGGGTLSVTDLAGTAAADLGIAASNVSSGKIDGGNLQRKYLSEATLLSQLNGGSGVPAGKFRITDSNGTSALIDLTQGNEKTLGDVLAEINSRGIGVTASINKNGDGIILQDTAGGAGTLKVDEDSGGTTATALHIAGTAAAGAGYIDGSFETRISVSNSDTLQTVLQKIRSSGAAVSASIIGDGSTGGGFRLSVSSQRSGVAGRIAVDGGTTGLDFSTLTRGRDAAVQIGTTDAGEPLILTSSSNTLNNAATGVTLNLLSASSQPVTVTVARDSKSLTDKLTTLATTYNAIASSIDSQSKFDSTTNTAGILLGDRSAEEVSNQLGTWVTESVSGAPAAYSRLSLVGFSLSDGQLSFDADKFQTAFTNNPDAVIALFTTDKTGLVAAISTSIDALTDTTNGSLTLRDNSLKATADELTTRKSQLQTLLDAQRARLTAQFQQTELTISKLQSQQTALGTLSSIANSFSVGSQSSSSSSLTGSSGSSGG